MSNIDDVLSSIYFDPKHPAGFSSKEKLYSAASGVDPRISRVDVENFLRGNLTYTLHYPKRNRFPRNPILVNHIHELHQADLTDMSEARFVRKNNGVRYLLTVIDVLSKQARIQPLKSKSAEHLVAAFKQMYSSWTKPVHIQTDRGTEFVNQSVLEYFRENGIHFYTTKNQTIKCAVVERFNRTIKEKIFKYVTSIGTERYIDRLDDFVDAYNNTIHRSIKMTPNQVNLENERSVFQHLFGVPNERIKIQQAKKSPGVAVGDTVRINYKTDAFSKSYTPRWQDAVFKITSRTKTAGSEPIYKIANEKNQSVPQRFYSYELQKISSNPSFRIEKILKYRIREGIKEAFVKFLNHSSDYNQWIPLTEIRKVRR